MESSMTLWLPQYCAHKVPRAGNGSFSHQLVQVMSAAEAEAVHAHCGTHTGGSLLLPMRASDIIGAERGARLRAGLDRTAAMLDWWFLASKSVAWSFTAIHDRYDQCMMLLKPAPRPLLSRPVCHIAQTRALVSAGECTHESFWRPLGSP